METLLAAVVGLIALLVLVRPARGGARSRSATVVAVAVAAVGAAAAWAWHAQPPKAGSEQDPLTAERPTRVSRDGYVSSDACRACHPDHYASWHHSYHRTMTQVVTPETLVSDWSGTLEWRGKTYELSREGDRFWVDMLDPEWGRNGTFEGKPIASGNRTRRVRKRAVLSTGSHHQQVYWVTSGEGRKLFLFDFTWLIAEQRWVPYEHTFLRYDLTHEQTEVWNTTCIVCHSTGGRPDPDPTTATFDTDVVEFGIACEACHGPGGEHVARNRDPLRRYAAHLAGDGDPTIVDPTEIGGGLSADVCGQCHATFGPATRAVQQSGMRNGLHYRPGDDLLDTRVFLRRPTDPAAPELSDPAALERFDGSFWSDGMVRVSGREYLGLTRSPCFDGGTFTCFSCHSMHSYVERDDQLARGMRGDEACLQCHEDFRSRIEEHTHHAAGSSGSACYNCHMPHTTYGLFTAIRSHTVSSPNVRESVTHGRPNACNLCHLDRTLAWTGEHLAEWYGAPQDPVEDPEFRERSAAALWLLKGDAGQRAISAWAFGWEPAREVSGRTWSAPLLAQALEDSYAAVRFIAHRSLTRLPGFEGFAYDYVAPHGARRSAVQRAVNAWPGEPDRSGQGVFLDAAGRFDTDAVQDVVRRRDERRLFLQE